MPGGGETFDVRKLNTPLDKMTREHAGKRSYTRTERKRGRYIKARPAGGERGGQQGDEQIAARLPGGGALAAAREEHRQHDEGGEEGRTRLGRLHAARPEAGRQRPAGESAAPPPPRTEKRREREGHEQCLLHEVPAVVDCRW